jgi:hypothetical protein
VPLVFDFRSFHDREAHAREDVFQLIADDRERVAVAEGRHATRQGDVDPIPRHRRARQRFPDRVAGIGEPLLDVALEVVGLGAALAAFVRGRRGQILQQPGDNSIFAAEVPIAERLNVARLGGRAQLRVELLTELRGRVRGLHGRQRSVAGRRWSVRRRD